MITREEHEARLALYNQGLSDAEIGRQLYLSPTPIYAWRKRNGLPSNHPKNPPAKATWLDLYNAGKNDHEIGRALGVSYATICSRRHRLALPSNYAPGRPKRH